MNPIHTLCDTEGDYGAFRQGMVPVAPDIIINGNSVTLTYTARHVSYPDDLGISWLLAVWDVHCGVYHR
ncbi:hypothetical protein ACLB1E_22225 [Escherichia coli]